MATRPALCVLAALLLLPVAGGVGADDAPVPPDQAKAAFLYAFTRYLEWPAGSFATPDSPLRIGLFCAGPPRGELEQVVRGRRVNGRAIEVRVLERPEDARLEHLVFVCAENDAKLPPILLAVKAAAVVVVGESERSWKAGGTISLIPVEDRMRFAIDLAAAERAGVKVSSQIQKLALSVSRGGRGP